MLEAVPPEKRAEWREWAKKQFGDDDRAVDAATASVLEALIAGYSVDEATAIGRAAAEGKPTTVDDTALGSDDRPNPDPERPTSDPEHLRGQVSSFRERSELMGTKYGAVWDFRVDSWDREGRPEPPVAVEMRGVTFNGSIGDGDWVEISSRWKPGELLHTRSLRNLTQSSTVIAGGSRATAGLLRTIRRVVVIVVVLAVLFYLLFGAEFHLWSTFCTTVDQPIC